MRVRRAGERDARAMGEGMAAVADEDRWLATPPGTPAVALIRRFADAIRAGHVLFVAVDEADVVGCLGLHPGEEDGVVDLGMWLLPPARGRGGGRLMIDAALAHAREQGLRRVELEVFDDNPRAEALYRATGFARTGARPALRRRHSDGSPVTLIAMALVP